MSNNWKLAMALALAQHERIHDVVHLPLKNTSIERFGRYMVHRKNMESYGKHKQSKLSSHVK